jgi:hypothetical protein
VDRSPDRALIPQQHRTPVSRQLESFMASNRRLCNGKTALATGSISGRSLAIAEAFADPLAVIIDTHDDQQDISLRANIKCLAR